MAVTCKMLASIPYCRVGLCTNLKRAQPLGHCLHCLYEAYFDGVGPADVKPSVQLRVTTS